MMSSLIHSSALSQCFIVGPPGLKPLVLWGGYGRAEARPLQSKGMSQGLKPGMVVGS